MLTETLPAGAENCTFDVKIPLYNDTLTQNMDTRSRRVVKGCHWFWFSATGLDNVTQLQKLWIKSTEANLSDFRSQKTVTLSRDPVPGYIVA
jgi:hypothetical protein